MTAPATVDHYQRVQYDRARYSVPRNAEAVVTVKAYPEQIEIGSRGQVVARHRRRYDGGQELDPLHYLVTLGRRPAALDHSNLYRRWDLPPPSASCVPGWSGSMASPAACVSTSESCSCWRNSKVGRFKPMADFDWSWPKKIDRPLIEELLQLGFLEEAANVVFVGPGGLGKTMIGQNMVHLALVRGCSALCVSASEMLNDLSRQDTSTALARRLRRYVNPLLLLLDESGFMLIPPVRRTWAPEGRTPIHRHRYRRDRISVIAGVSVSPKRQRLGLYFRLHATNIGHEEVYDFLWWLLKHLRGHIIVLWDNASIHRDGPVAELCAKHRRLHLEYFPPYAPELNPASRTSTPRPGSGATDRPASAAGSRTTA